MRRSITVLGLFLLPVLAAACQQPTTVSEVQPYRRVAFIANYMEGHEHYGNYIVSMREDGSSQVELSRWAILLEGHSHLWSKDGKSIAYLEGEEMVSGVIQTEPSWLVVADADGSERRQLLNLAGIEVSSMSLSPDGKTVLLVCEAKSPLPTPGEPPPDPLLLDPRVLWVPDLYAFDVATRELKRLTDDTDIIAAYPVFSPDQRNIAFIGATMVWVERSENGAIVRFQDHSQTKQGIYVMNADGSGLRKLTDYQAKPSFAFSDRRLQWSPDGKRILFSQSDAVANYTDLFTVDVATGKTTNLTNSPGVFDSDFSWSPDGKKIAFTSGNLTTDYGLFVFGVYVMDADGSKMVKLGDSLTQPSWSADGKQLMAISRPNRDFWAIVTLSLQGTVTNTLMQTGGNKYQMVRYPIWLAR